MSSVTSDFKIFLLIYKCLGISSKVNFYSFLMRIFMICVYIFFIFMMKRFFVTKVDEKFSICALFNSLEQILHCIFVLLIYLALLRKSKDIKLLIASLEAFDARFEKTFGQKIDTKYLNRETFVFFLYSSALYGILFQSFTRDLDLITRVLVLIHYLTYTVTFEFMKFLINNIWLRVEAFLRISSTLIVRREVLEDLFDNLMEIYKFIQKKFQILLLICLCECCWMLKFQFCREFLSIFSSLPSRNCQSRHGDHNKNSGNQQSSNGNSNDK